MSDNQQSRRSSGNSHGSGYASRPTAMRISTTEVDKLGRRRRSRSPKRAILPHRLHPSWVILNRVGARRDSFHGDFTTSAVSHTSNGKQISVSFELVEPPETSLLVLDWPHGPDPMESTLSHPHVISSHGNTVLFEVTSGASCLSRQTDYFVYAASSEPSKQPSLSRLPVCYWKGTTSSEPRRPRILNRKATGVLCLNEHPLSFQVFELEQRTDSASRVNIFVYGSDIREWKVLQSVRVYNSSKGSDLCWWSTDAVLSWSVNQLIWVDYYRGMIIGKFLGDKAYLRYVALPVDSLDGDTYNSEYGRGCPEAFRSLCVLWNHCVKFVDVNQKCNNGFSITIWSWAASCDIWTKEAKLDASELWALDTQKRLPLVRPEFPVVNMMHGDAVYFFLSTDNTSFIIEVDVKKHVLLGATHYSCEVNMPNARLMSQGLSFISSDMPHYLRWDVSSQPAPMRISTWQPSLGSSSSWRATATTHSRLSWVILTRAGARRDLFNRDCSTLSFSYTSAGDQIFVSLELVEPPEISVLTLHWPQGPDPIGSNLSYPYVIAADNVVVLFEMTLRAEFRNNLVNYFVYKASIDPCLQPSLLLLPTLYHKDNWSGRRPRQHILSKKSTGILSYGTKSFIVAELQTTAGSCSGVDIYLLQSRTLEWTVFKCLPVHFDSGGPGSLGWSPDVVLPYNSKSLIWVDYCRGIVFAEMGNNIMCREEPRLSYISLPEEARSFGKALPEATHSLAVTGSGIRFVAVNDKKNCSSGVGSTFCITLWSLDSHLKWNKDASMDSEDLWALDSENRFPHVLPEFPVINMENPDSIFFLLNEGRYSAMIEVDMRKAALLAVTSYSQDITLPAENTTKYARLISQGSSFVSSKISSYLYLYKEETCLKRRMSTKQEIEEVA